MQKYIFLLVNISMNVEAAVLLCNTECCFAYFMHFRESLKILLNVIRPIGTVVLHLETRWLPCPKPFIVLYPARSW